jgi:hypothetical protein
MDEGRGTVHLEPKRVITEAGQFSLAAMVIALAVVLTLSGILIGISFNGDSGSGTSGAPGVGTADDLQAKTTLSTIQPAIEAAAESGGYGGLTPAELEANAPGVTYTAGPSTSSNTVSVANTGGAGGSATGVTLPGGQAMPSLGGGSSDGSSGTATFAVYSNSGTCFYQWFGTGGPFDGVETGQHSCQAVPIAVAPAPSAPSSTGIGWQQNSFPTT